jgi:pantothenate kinase
VLVLVEGLYLLHRADGWEALEGLLDAVYYLDTPPQLAAQRLCQRHMAAWGISEAEALARIARNDGLNAQLVAGTRGSASALLAPE